MGMPIEEEVKNIKEQLADVSTKYRMMQANYNARLKADLEAILVEIQLEIEESENCGKAFHLGLQMASNIIQQKINELPPVTPIRPKGHWIEHPHEAGPNWEYSMYECSECHGWAEDDSDYCPNCGCKMVELQESEVEE